MFFFAFPTKTQAEGSGVTTARQNKAAKMNEAVEQRSEYWM